MVLAGFVVALGSIVDDAIIDVENIVRRLREHRRQGGTQSMASIILEASLEIRSPIVYATLIIVLAVVPVFFMGGLSGAFFEPLALSYALSLLASMVVALTVTPALCLHPPRQDGRSSASRPLVRMAAARIITRCFRGSSRRPRAAYVAYRRARCWPASSSGRCSGSRCFPRSRSATS